MAKIKGQLKNFWFLKIKPNKKIIAARVVRMGVFYMLATPAAAALAADTFGYKQLAKNYAAVMDSCFGSKLDIKIGYLPVPQSYKEGALCAAMLLTCAVAATEGFGNPVLDAACVGIVRTLADSKLK